MLEVYIYSQHSEEKMYSFEIVSNSHTNKKVCNRNNKIKVYIHYPLNGEKVYN